MVKLKVCQCKKEWVDDSSGFETCPSCRKNAPKVKKSKRSKYNNPKNRLSDEMSPWQENTFKHFENL